MAYNAEASGWNTKKVQHPKLIININNRANHQRYWNEIEWYHKTIVVINIKYHNKKNIQENTNS